MASSSKSKWIYDVFLSFRGTDLRKNFVGHLYKSLNHNGIYTFVDSKELRKGDQISPALMKAIEESRIAIIIFSKDYASSTWCLEEVATIMECKEQGDLIVFSVFYKVEPREVRTPRETYNEAMVKHESKFGKDSEKVKRWKKALSDASSLSGWHLNDGDESKLIQRIVKEISTHIDQTPLHVAKHPVGIESRVVKLKAMLKLESGDDVVMVGLWGQGGIGKTTLAKAHYNSIFRQFEGSCFLANVRETSKGSSGLVTLQETLLNDILLLQQRLEVSTVERGINLIQRRLGRKKVLIILDDVDDLCQLQALAGASNWFGNGSWIIITTRDKHLLTSHEINQVHVYEVEALDHSEAHKLLSKHAFPTHPKLEIKTNLVYSVVNYAQGLPLALEVLGSFLCGRREQEWESTLKKLSKVPNNKINSVLKISYDGLEENEKEIFLDIACFFNGRNSYYIMKVLDGCDLDATIGLEVLIERSLISIKNGILRMHDLIQSMGIDIVRRECPDDPNRRSRLWLYDDVCDVLSSNMLDCAVKAIVLEPPMQKELTIHPYAFTKMRRLRLLIVSNVYSSFQGPIWLPNELRWFERVGCDPWNLHFSSGPKKLTRLDTSNCNITRVMDLHKGFHQLKYIKLTDCNSLVSTPDLSYIPNLEKFKLLNCKSLVEAHDSIANHNKLQVLNLDGCSQLKVFPKVLKSKNLRDLWIVDCAKFERFPDIPHKLEGLINISLYNTAIKELPASIENLVSLKSMCLNYNKNLVSLPSNICKLQNIKCLELNECKDFILFPKFEGSAGVRLNIGLSNLNFLSVRGCNLSDIEFLKDPSCWRFLRELNLGFTDITSLPTSICKLDHLSDLDNYGCHQLQELFQLPPPLNYLGADECKSSQTNGHLTSTDQWARQSLATVDIASPYQNSCCTICLSGGEMPDWLQPVEESFVSFMASKDLYDKFLGLILCAVLSNDEANGRCSHYEVRYECQVKIVAHFNGKRQGQFNSTYGQMDSDHISLGYCPPSYLWKEVDFDQIDGRYAQFNLTQLSGDVKKWGFRIICKQLDDDLKVEIGDNRLIDPAFLYEVVHDSIDPEAERSLTQEDSPMEMDLLKNF